MSLRMEALGLIETQGMAAAIEAADAMLKSAGVRLEGREFAGGGLVCVTVRGDVAAVTAAVEAGAEAARRTGGLAGARVIAHPHAQAQTGFKERPWD